MWKGYSKCFKVSLFRVTSIMWKLTLCQLMTCCVILNTMIVENGGKGNPMHDLENPKFMPICEFMQLLCFNYDFAAYEYILCLNHIFMCNFPPSVRNIVTFNYMWDIPTVSHIQQYTWTESKLNQPAERIRFIDLHIHMVYARAKQGTNASMNPPL